MPCIPKESVESFQNKPRPIHVYGFNCEVAELRFLLSVKNHLNGFDSKTMGESFESNEFLLKGMFGEVAKFSVRKDFNTNGFTSRDYDIELKDGGRIRSLIVVNEFATYEALVGVAKDKLATTRRKSQDFENVAKKFIESVQVMAN